MKWTENTPPKEGQSYYDHCISKSPLGEFIIEWKSWKDNPSYCIMLEGVYIGTQYDLQTAKDDCKEYLERKVKDLQNFLAQ